MAGANSDLLAIVQNYFATTPVDVMAMHALIGVMWFPILAVLVHGMALLWLDYKQGKFAAKIKNIVMEVQVPRDTVQTPKGMENFFANLYGMISTPTWQEKWMMGKDYAVFSFEIVSLGGEVHFYIHAQEKYKSLLPAMLYAQYPEAVITVVPDWMDAIETDYPNEEHDLFGGEIVHKNKPYFPIRTYEDFEHQGEKDNRFKDPLLTTLEILGQVRPDEVMGIQIVMSAHDGQWVKDGLEFLGKIMGKEPKAKAPGTAEQLAGALASLPTEAIYQLSGLDIAGTHAGDAPKKADDFRAFKLTQAEKMQIEYVAEKIAKVGWQAKIRWFARGRKGKFRKGEFAASMKAIIQPYNSPITNGLAYHGPSVPKDDYFWQAWWMYAGKQKKLVTRYKERSLGAGATPTILGVEELATLWHFPAADARTPVLQSIGARRAEAPIALPMGAQEDFYDWKRAQVASVEEDVAPVSESSPIDSLPQPPSITLPAPSMDLPDDNGAQPPENLPI
jgi:hypothetical protein